MQTMPAMSTAGSTDACIAYMQAVPTSEAAAEAIRSLMPALGKALLFMGHLRTLRFLRWDSEAPEPNLVTQAASDALSACARHIPLQ